MKKLKIFTLAAILGLTFSGCSNLNKLKEVKSVALVGYSVRKDITTVKDGKEDLGVNLVSISNKGIKLGPLNEKTIAFYKEILADLKVLFKENGITIISPENFKNKTEFNTFNDGQSDNNNFLSSVYTIAPYKKGVGAFKIDRLKKLAEELDVDAVAFFNIYVIKTEKKVLLVPTSTMGLKANLQMIHRDGTVIQNSSSYLTVNADEQLDGYKMLLGDAASSLQITPENEPMFKQLKTRFVEKVDSLIKKAQNS